MSKPLVFYAYLLLSVFHLVSWFVWGNSFNLYTKPMLMPLLMLYLYERTKGQVYAETLLLFGALVFSWGGDIALMFPENYFLLGVGLFLVTQLLYSYLFFKQRNTDTSFINWKSGAVVLFGVILFYVLLPKSGDLMIPIIVYGLTLLTMALLAVNRKVGSDYLMVAIGGISFLLSDALIAIDRFAYDIPYASIWIMLTYLLAQYLIVEGMIKSLESSR